MRDYSRLNRKTRRKKHKLVKIVSRFFIIFFTTILLLLVLLFGVLFILLKGPSEQATKLFALSCYETSAMKWVPGLFLSDSEFDAILHPASSVVAADDVGKAEEVDFKALPIAKDAGEGVSFDGEVNVDESLPELEINDLIGGTYKGKIMIVRNPARVQVGSIDSFGGVGKTMLQFLEMYDALGGTNAGGFEDEDGKGKGGIPDGIVIKNGKITYGSAGSHYRAIVGFTDQHVLCVGSMSGQEALNRGIVNGTSFENGPVLILDGERQSGFVSGINPRTCIGQTADGTVLLVAVEGRMADSLGATFDDLCDIMEEYGAVNACNLDGGSSSGMYYMGERITRSSSLIGERPLPTAIIVSK